MYIPPQYKEEDREAIVAFIEKNGFGILVNQTDAKLWATHIPMMLQKTTDGNLVLTGHISKENPQWKSFETDCKILAIFSGPHAYISSTWYEKENVPTWNYIAVHVYGNIKIIEGQAEIDALSQLVDKYEAQSVQPLRLETLSEKTMRQVNGIVSFEITVEEIQAVKKMSQNRNDKDYHTIITELEKTQNPDAQAVATVMKCTRGN